MAAFSLAGCARELPGQTAPQAFYFPIDVRMAADARHAYVVNSDFDLRFASGWISVVDLDLAAGLAAAGPTAPVDAKSVIVSQLKVPQLAGPLAINDTGTFGVLSHRGDLRLTIIEMQDGGATLSCGDPEAEAGLSSQEQRTDCDRNHLFRLDTDANLQASAWNGTIDVEELRDPFDIAFFTSGGEQWVAVSFLSRVSDRLGTILVYHFDPNGAATGSFLMPAMRLPVGSSAVGTSGVSSMALRPPTPDTEEGRVFLAAGSRRLMSSDRESTVYVFDMDSFAGPTAASGPTAKLERARTHPISTETGGFEVADLRFAPDGQTLYVANRNPDGIVVFDMHLAPLPSSEPSETVLMPRGAITGFVPLEGQPTGLTLMPQAGPAAGDVLATLSFDEDALFLLSARGQDLIPVSRLDGVGAGPFRATSVARSATETWLLVAAFFDHGLSIVSVPAADLQQTRRLVQFRDPELEPATENR